MPSFSTLAPWCLRVIYPLSIEVPLHLKKISCGPIFVSLFLDCVLLLSVCVALHKQEPACFSLCSFITSLEIRECESSNFCSFSKLFCLLWVLCFPAYILEFACCHLQTFLLAFGLGLCSIRRSARRSQREPPSLSPCWLFFSHLCVWCVAWRPCVY